MFSFFISFPTSGWERIPSALPIDHAFLVVSEGRASTYGFPVRDWNQLGSAIE